MWLAACSRPGSPVRTLVLLSGGIDAGADQRLARQVADGLDELGFEASAQTGSLVASPEDAREVMAEAGAASALVLHTSAHADRPGLIAGTELQVVELEVYAVSEQADHPVTRTNYHWLQERHSAAEVEKRVLNTWTNASVGWAADALYQMPTMARVLAKDVEMSELDAANALAKRARMVKARRDRVAAYQAYCGDQAETLSNTAQANGVRCVGDPCGQTTALGFDPEGRVIVQDSSRVPLFGVPLPRKPTWLEPPERILAIPLTPADAEPVVLLRSANFYGFANFLGGAPHAAVETFSAEQTSGIYGFSLQDGARAQVSLLGPKEESRFSRVSPDGKVVMACLTDGSCFVDLGAGRQPVRSYRLAELVELDGETRIFGQLQSGELSLEDPSHLNKGRKLATRRHLTRVLGVQGGALMAVTRTKKDCGLLRFDPSKRAAPRFSKLPSCLSGAVLHPDGRLLGTARVTGPGDTPGDDEVVVWRPGDRSFTPITRGSYQEEYPHLSADGSQVVFSRRLPPPPKEFSTGHYRRVSCVAEVPSK